MTETPGILDPESFPSEDAFRKQLLEDGLKQGWTPIEEELPEEPLKQSDQKNPEASRKLSERKDAARRFMEKRR